MKKLQVGKTKIGERTGKYEGQFIKFSIYYGNYSMPPVNGEYVHLKKDKYLALLNEFLESPEGKDYLRPTEEEIEEACLEVVNRELKAQQNKKQAPLKEAIREDFEKPIQKEPEVKPEPLSKPQKEKEKDSLLKSYKRQITILTIAVIFLVLVVALQMLLNLYLFTR